MIVWTLDVKATHIKNPNCKMRLAQDPKGQWYCVDCGFPILMKRIEIKKNEQEE